MANDDEAIPKPVSESDTPESQQPPSPQLLANPSETPLTPTNTSPEPTDSREDLLTRARSFLASPQIQQQDISSKRRFLNEKGLTDSEIDGLLREIPQPPPTVPPRAYPHPPPSDLPNLLIGIFKLFSYLAGASTLLVYAYHRFILPRLIRSQEARSSLKYHHLALIRNLSSSLSSLQASQAESYSVVPHPQRYAEDPRYSDCHSISDVVASFTGDAEGKTKQTDKDVNIKHLPEISLLRCAIEEFSREKNGKKPTLEELFGTLVSKVPWLSSDEGSMHQKSLLQTLSTCPLFECPEDSKTPVWTYIPPASPEPSPLLSALTNLVKSITPLSHREQNRSPFQETLQTFSSFTGYLATQLYAARAISFRAPALMNGIPFSAEEDLRKEIRALKGLVLNRRSFIPSENMPPTSASTAGIEKGNAG